MCDGRPGEFGSVDEAVVTARAALGFLVSADAGGLPTETLAQAVRGLCALESVHVAARSRFLSVFTANDAAVDDGQATTRAWLLWQTRATRAAAGSQVKWMRSLDAHPGIAAALAAADLSPSWARQLCAWSDELPAGVRDDADEILLAAAVGGADLAGLAGLAREIRARTVPPEPDGVPPDSGEDAVFRDRWVRLDVHYQGAGRLEGDLTPEAAAVVAALLESLGKKAGPEDDRSVGQRHHDALEEAGRMLLAAGSLPDVAGQPAQVLVHATLSQLLGLADARGPAADTSPFGPGAGTGTCSGAGTAASYGEGPGAAGGPGTARMTDAFLSGRAAGDGEAGWLATAVAARAYACDAKIATVVAGHADPLAIAAAVRCFMACHDSLDFPAPGDGALDFPGDPAGSDASPPAGQLPGSPGPAGAGLPTATMTRLGDTLARHATAMLSGPAGLASALRSGLPGPLGAAASLPLDITSPTATVPPHLRRAVIVRDRHCAFPGCAQVSARCQVHHIIPRSRGGPTILANLLLLCGFHHLILIHRRGWSIVLHPDGTTTATSPDRGKILHSHGPPGSRAA